jgi:hypothetical protein
MFYNIVNIIVIGLIPGCLVDVVAVMGDVFALVYNFQEGQTVRSVEPFLI